MLQVLKKLPQAANARSWKAILYSVLIICWAVIFIGSFKIITLISRGDLDGALRDSGIFFTGLAIIIIWFFLKGYKK